MPQYIITTPDGKRLRVNAPEGATKEQALQYVKSQHKAQAAENAPAQPEYSPLDGMSAYDRFFAGAGKAVVDLGRGVRQIGAQVADYVSPRSPSMSQLITGEDPSRAAEIQREIDSASERDQSLMRDTAGVVGNVAGNVGAFYAGGGLLQAPALAGRGAQLARVGQAIAAPKSYTAAAATGAAIGGLQPVVTGGNRAENAGMGAAFGVGGQTVANTLGRVAVPIKRALTPADQRAVGILQKAGVPLDAAQKSGSPVLQRIKSALKDNPVTLPAQTEQFQRQQTAFNRAVLRSIGVTADAADETTMGAAKARIGKVFNDVLPQTSIAPSSKMVSMLQALAERSKRLLPGDTNQITRTVDDLLSHAKQNGGKIDGNYFNTIRSDIAALESEKGVAPVARQLRELLDNAFTQAAKPGDAKRLVEARRMWRNMRIIEGAIDTEGVGNISAAKLANQFGNKSNRSVGVYGQGDKSVTELARLAKAGKRLIPDKLPNSGTVPRALAQAALPAAVGAAYGGLKEGDLSGAVAYGLGAAALPYALQRGLNAPGAANYLASGLRAGQTRNALLGLQGSAALRVLPIAATPAVIAK